MEKVIKGFDSNVNNVLENMIKKPTIVRGIVHLLLVLYVVKLAPALPKKVTVLFDNIYFKLFIFSLVLWTAQFSPSTSILLALAFLVSVTYINTGNVWEFMDNVAAMPSAMPVPPEVKKVADAVVVLANNASAPTAAAPEVIAPAAETVAAVVQTQQGLDATKSLAEQALTPAPGVPAKVADAVSTVVNSITAVTPEVKTQQVTNAINVLASAASAPTPSSPAAIAPAAQVVAEVVKTQAGLDAVKALANQAVSNEAAAPAQVSNAVSNIVQSITTPVATPAAADAQQASGCYPMRNYDMSKVSPNIDGKSSFEDYQAFVPSV